MAKTLDQLKAGGGSSAAEEDDFQFGDTNKGKETKEVVAEEIEEKKTEVIAEDDIVDEIKPEDKASEKEEEKEEEEKEEKKEEVSIDDFFGGDVIADEKKDDKPFDFKSLANEFEIEAEDKDTFKAKLSEKLENAKQEFKVDKFTPDAQSIIKHLNENEGRIEDFFANQEIIQLQSILALDAETKVKNIRINELTGTGLNREEAIEQATEEILNLGTREIKDIADRIDQDAKKLITTEVTKIVGEREKIVAKQREAQQQKVQKEIMMLKNFVSSQDEFMGIKLTPQAKQNIVHEIETGTFDIIADKSPEASKFAAYMISKFGSKIVENFVNKTAEKNREGYNAATEKHVSALHKTKEEAQTKKVGRSSTSQNGKNFESWDDSLFE